MSHASQLLINQLGFILPNNKPLFSNLNFTFAERKIGLVGRNGIGKSTLFKLITGELAPSFGNIQVQGKIAYVPQNPVINPKQTVAELLGFAEKLQALKRISAGSIDEKDYAILNEDWEIEKRWQQQLDNFGLGSIPSDRYLTQLSGGEITRLLLAKAFSATVDFILLDEPTNNLDSTARSQLYKVVQQWQKGLIVISHDRSLLNLMDEIVELSSLGAKNYGGNYAFYVEQKSIEEQAALQTLQARKEIIAKAKNVTQLRKERHEQNEAKGRRAKYAQIKAKGSYDKITLKSAKGRSERTNRRIRLQADRKLENLESELQKAKEKIDIKPEIHVDLAATSVPSRKIVLEIDDLNFTYPDSTKPIFENLSIKILGPERIALTGPNGSGKSTLVKLILGELYPQQGKIYLGTEFVSYLDQKTALLNPDLSILENFLRLNPEMNEHDAYWSLSQFLFRNTAALKLAKELSGGEKIRALLACVLMAKHPPQLLILDEPTNHLDLNSIQSIESALKNFQGAMIVISHDESFLKNIEVTTEIKMYLS